VSLSFTIAHHEGNQSINHKKHSGGGPIELEESGVTFISAPPIAIIVDQEIVQDQTVSVDGILRKSSHVDQLLIGFTCSITDEGVCIYPLDIEMALSATPERKFVALSKFVEPLTTNNLVIGSRIGGDSRPSKKLKVGDDDPSLLDVIDLPEEIAIVASYIEALIEDEETTEMQQ
jgi:hypothetical protein